MLLRDLRRRVKKYGLSTLVLGLVLYFLFHLIQGGRGLMKLQSLQTSLEKAEQDLTRLKQEHDDLEHKVSLMKPGAVCPDLLEEEAKATLGYTHPGEKVVLDPGHLPK